MKAALSAQINKSDRNDARGIAQMMRVGLYRPVHVKTLASQKRRMLLTSRQLLQAKASTSRTICVARCAISASRLAWWARSSSRLEFASWLRTIRTWPRSSNGRWLCGQWRRAKSQHEVRKLIAGQGAASRPNRPLHGLCNLLSEAGAWSIAHAAISISFRLNLGTASGLGVLPLPVPEQGRIPDPSRGYSIVITSCDLGHTR